MNGEWQKPDAQPDAVFGMCFLGLLDTNHQSLVIIEQAA